jgi:hypothetical protein
MTCALARMMPRAGCVGEWLAWLHVQSTKVYLAVREPLHRWLQKISITWEEWGGRAPRGERQRSQTGYSIRRKNYLPIETPPEVRIRSQRSIARRRAWLKAES